MLANSFDAPQGHQLIGGKSLDPHARLDAMTLFGLVLALHITAG